MLFNSDKGDGLGGSALFCLLKSCDDGFSDGLPFLEHSGHVMILIHSLYLALDYLSHLTEITFWGEMCVLSEAKIQQSLT